jgi:hypothetical protein
MCISLSMDNDGPSDRADKGKVLEFLKKEDATFLNFLVLNFNRDAVRFARRLGLEGAIPHMALFDKSGKKVWDSEQKRLSNSDLDKLIEEQLAK